MLMFTPARNTATARPMLEIAASRLLRSTGTKLAIFIARERIGIFINSFLSSTLHLRGINAKVVQAGTIRAGDRARKV